MPDYLHGVHDIEGAELMADKPGWIVVTVAIGCDPKDHSGINLYAWTSRGFKVIVRLNNGYRDRDNRPGTIPTPDRYPDFAQRCANFVGASPGVNLVIIGNEPNHSDECPDGKKIDPTEYARCYSACRQAIQSVSAGTKVLVAGCAPWNDEAGMFWLDYWSIVLNNLWTGADGFAIHAYTHGSDPALITSEEINNRCHWHFRVYRDQLARLQGAALDLPVYITETDQGDIPWADANSGWVQAAYTEIDGWNQAGNKPTIHALALYCTHKRDRWYLMDKEGVKADFRAAVAKGFQSPMPIPPAPQPPNPQPQPPTPQPPTTAPGPIVWDPRLDLRGCTLTPAQAVAGQPAWKVTVGKWFNKDEAQNRINIFIRVLDANGQLAIGVPVTQFWSSGSATKPTEHKSDPWLASQGLGADYSLDFPMNAVAPSYGVVIEDGKTPSDKINGCGLGSIEQPDYKIHTAYFFEYRLNTSTGPTPPVPIPVPPDPATGYLLWPVAGPVTQRFGENPANYAKFGQAGHNGIDLGVPEGTPVRVIADGEVMFTGTDKDYGNYVRVWHPSLHSHSFYAHLSAISAQVGAQVRQGQVIAQSGNTGNSTGPHLHFELRGGTRDAYYSGSYGYTQGRYDPQVAYLLTGSALTPGASLDRA